VLLIFFSARSTRRANAILEKRAHRSLRSDMDCRNGEGAEAIKANLRQRIAPRVHQRSEWRARDLLRAAKTCPGKQPSTARCSARVRHAFRPSWCRYRPGRLAGVPSVCHGSQDKEMVVGILCFESLARTFANAFGAVNALRRLREKRGTTEPGKRGMPGVGMWSSKIQTGHVWVFLSQIERKLNSNPTSADQ